MLNTIVERCLDGLSLDARIHKARRLFTNENFPIRSVATQGDWTVVRIDRLLPRAESTADKFLGITAASVESPAVINGKIYTIDKKAMSTYIEALLPGTHIAADKIGPMFVGGILRQPDFADYVFQHTMVMVATCKHRLLDH